MSAACTHDPAQLVAAAEGTSYCPACEAEARYAELRRLLYEVIREVPVSAPSVAMHADLQRLHRRVIGALAEPDPGEFVPYDYWIGRSP